MTHAEPELPDAATGARTAVGGAPRSDLGDADDLVIDCVGHPCPVPVIELARALPDVPVGAVVRVLADDPAAALDVPAWCRMRGQTYLGAVAGPGYRVRRLV